MFLEGLGEEVEVDAVVLDPDLPVLEPSDPLGGESVHSGARQRPRPAEDQILAIEQDIDVLDGEMLEEYLLEFAQAERVDVIANDRMWPSMPTWS